MGAIEPLSFDLSIIPQDAESAADFIEAVRALAGTSKAASSVVTKFFGPAFWRNWKKIYEKYERLRGKVPPERHTEASPSVLIPLVDAASQESREELQDLWAALLANSMIDGGKKVRRAYIEAVSKFEPLDAVVLQRIADLPMPNAWLGGGLDANMRYIVDFQNTGVGPDEWAVSYKSLRALGCLDPVPANVPDSYVVISSFGKKLLEACTVA